MSVCRAIDHLAHLGVNRRAFFQEAANSSTHVQCTRIAAKGYIETACIPHYNQGFSPRAGGNETHHDAFNARSFKDNSHHAGEWPHFTLSGRAGPDPYLSFWKMPPHLQS